MSKTIIAVRHFGLGGRESLETAVIIWKILLHIWYLFFHFNVISLFVN